MMSAALVVTLALGVSAAPCDSRVITDAKVLSTRLVTAAPACAESLVASAAVAIVPAVRLVAADSVQLLSPARAAAALWLLGEDPTVDVRVAALEASAARCQRGEGAECVRVLSRFVIDVDDEVSWLARDRLLAIDVDAALFGAPVAYKVEAIATLGVMAERASSPQALHALEDLALDVDPEVSERAHAAIARIQP